MEYLTEGSPLAAGRANACLALSRAFDPPRSWDAELPDNLRRHLRYAASATSAELAAAAERALSEEGKEQAAVVHSRLFLGPFKIEAAPWACAYLDTEQRLMGPVSQFAADAYAEAGVGPGEAADDAPDHVAYELEFMYFLAFRETMTGESVWLERQQRFWRDHMGLWLPRLADAIAKAASDDDYFRLLAQVTHEFCDWEAMQLGIPGSRPAL